MKDNQSKRVTIIYYDIETIELKYYIGNFPVKAQGRVLIPDSFKDDKSIVAVCEGEHLASNVSNLNISAVDRAKVTATLFYYQSSSLELQLCTNSYSVDDNGRVCIPDDFKQKNSIIAVYQGRLNILNKAGDRAFPVEKVA
ncbi:DUF2375 family protein [Thalassotalea crassostreae]|uniref:DUF2375 family protein n=1 Tax=Thalassotalea crassostreae TaxID=1763536 RepID=UPI0012FD3846|nr:DUF2375 family protein [Thalassotalea crassostreae]